MGQHESKGMDHRQEHAALAVEAIVREILEWKRLREAWQEFDEKTQADLRARFATLIAEAFPSPDEADFIRAIDATRKR